MIQNDFQKDGYKLRVINAGQPGHDTRHFPALLLLDLHRYEPDIVIINSIWNDTKWISRVSDSTLLLEAKPQALKKNAMIEQMNILDKMLGFSAFYRKVRDFYWKRKLKLDSKKTFNEGIIENRDFVEQDFTRGLEQYRTNIIGAIQIIKGINAIPVLAIEEKLVSYTNTTNEKRIISYHYVNIQTHDELVKIFRDCDSILKEVSHKFNVPLINANVHMEGDINFFKDHTHTTPKGSQFIANYYFNFLKPLVKGISSDRINQ